MSLSPFKLPETLPIFPLAGALLLPGGRLPLHIFELRYRNMIEDALENEPYLGIVQPRDGDVEIHADDLPPNDDAPSLYGVGCTGHLERSEQMPDGRYLVLLRGMRRFRIVRELEPQRGYRRVEVSYDEFGLDDLEMDEATVASEQLMKALQAFGEEHQIAFELDKLRDLPGLALLNSIAMTLPFPPAEKQALLEAPNVEVRYETLLALMHMSLASAKLPTETTTLN